MDYIRPATLQDDAWGVERLAQELSPVLKGLQEYGFDSPWLLSYQPVHP